MNLITSPVSTSNVTSTPAEQEVLNLRALLEEAERKATAERAEADRAAKEALHNKVLSIITELGAASAAEAIRIIQSETGATPAPARPKTAKRAFPSALPQETLAQMRAMLEAGATSRAVAEALGCGISTVDARKARWKLTHRGLGGRPAFKRAPKTRRKNSGRHFTAAQRARIVAALQKPGHRVALIAKREGSSREAIYAIRRQLPQLQAA